MRATKAFSLVELSIVLVILGLLVGGVLAGQSLIKASQLRGLTRDADRFTTATYAFRDKYLAMPGDMNNAERFWGTWSTDGTAAGVVGAKNGNGDRQIGTTEQYERAQYFRHLALAGLIEGSFAGNFAEPANTYTPDVNVPRTRYTGNSRIIPNSNPDPYASIYGRRGTYLIMQGLTSPYSFISPQDAWNVDTKRDDGIPSSGSIMGLAEGVLASRNCTTNDDWQTAAAGSATYKMDVASIECWMAIWIQ